MMVAVTTEHTPVEQCTLQGPHLKEECGLVEPKAHKARLRLDALAASDCETVRHWRNTDDIRLGLRTPYVLTHGMQARFYEQVVSQPQKHRYWAIRGERFLGMAGLTDIEWENGHAEISLVLDPAEQGKGHGMEVVGLVLTEAFHRMRLLTVFGEVYEHNPARAFWFRALQRYGAEADNVLLPRRKWWDGVAQAGIVFWFRAEAFRS